MEDYCSTITCLNGATCYERGVKFECVCAEGFYGTFCADRKFLFLIDTVY